MQETHRITVEYRVTFSDTGHVTQWIPVPYAHALAPEASALPHFHALALLDARIDVDTVTVGETIETGVTMTVEYRRVDR